MAARGHRSCFVLGGCPMEMLHLERRLLMELEIDIIALGNITGFQVASVSRSLQQRGADSKEQRCESEDRSSPF